jgi:hypothetical protein
MPDIDVEGPDGQVHTFPSGTPDDQIISYFGGKGKLQTIQSPAPATALPGPGDPSAVNGAIMPSLQSTPPYQTAEDRANIALSTLLPRGSVQALQNTPGHAYRMEQAKKAADTVEETENRQRLGATVLRSIAQLQDSFQNTPDDVLKGAIGPRNTKPYSEHLPFIGGMTDPQAATAYSMMPNFTGSPSAKKSWEAQNLFGHDVNGIVTAIMQGGKSINMSDARQQAYTSTVKDFLSQPDRRSAQEILDHLKGIVANDFNLPPYKANQIMREHMADIQLEKAKAQHAAATGAAPQSQQTAAPTVRQFRNKATGAIENFQWNGSQWQKAQ